jgi:hypothetical protein
MRQLIKDLFEAKFSEEKYQKFIANLLFDYDTTKAFSKNISFPEIYKEFVSSFSRLGTYTSPDSDVIDILVVHLKRTRSIEAARNAQRNFIAYHLKIRDNKEAALVAFVSPDSSDWRFSLVKSTIENVKQESGKFKLTQKFSPAKRWSYLVGASERSHTAQSMLIPIMTNGSKPTLGELEQAFSIESVTDEFFAEYKNLYFTLVEALEELLRRDKFLKEEFTNKGISTIDFSKKLLGQIVFLYFLQKKGWLGVPKEGNWGEGSKRFLRDLIEEKYKSYYNFFNDVLEHLFYEALASDRSVYNHFSTFFNCRLPFLNGGLFDPIGNYNWIQTNILLPDSLFSNAEINKLGDTGTGILDVFDRYNFTVKEDEPLETEVAVDPEMLGKVFENLLDLNDRKSTGSYYTPRDVVHYMCVESLVRYLEPQLKHVITDEELRDFIRLGDYTSEREVRVAEKGKETAAYSYQTPECIRKNAETIDKLLADVKVCDPAIGSGAFPVGILTEIVKVRGFLSPFIDDKTGRSPYNFKRHSIQNSIYGVDISGSAVEIAKLRLWLSLVVDEDNLDDIKPLPNLDYKIVVGNSLLRVQEELFESDDYLFVENLKLTFFDETNSDKKKAEKERIDGVFKAKTGGNNTFDFTLYFSEIFKDNSRGFDIVIGNPPFINLSSFKGKPEQKLYKEQGFDTYEATGDIYCLFYERGIKIAKMEKGILCFITSNKWMRAGYGAKLREFLSKKNPVSLLDFGGVKIFKNATVDTNILIIRTDLNKNSVEAVQFKNNFTHGDDIHQYFSSNKAILKNLSSETWFIGSEAEIKLKEKIEKLGKPLKEWDIKINYGIKTGFNEAFIIDEATRQQLIAEDPKSDEIIKPMLRGRDIKRYSHEWAGLYLLATGYNLNIPLLYPAIYKHLLKFEDKAKKREDQGENWYNLRACSYYAEFEKKKIIYPNMTKYLPFLYDNKKYFANQKCFIITGENLPYLTGFLNSALFKAVFRDNFPELLGGTRELSKIFFELLRIQSPNSINKDLLLGIEKLVVNRAIETEEINIRILDNKIDQLIYELYELTTEEIAIIEGK